MVKKILGVAILLVLLVVPAVFAFETSITVKTTTNSKVDIRIYTSDMKEKIDEFLFKTADENGEIVVTHSSNRNIICITTFIKGLEDGFQKFKNVIAGREVYINLNKGIPTLEYLDEEEPEVNETEEINETSEDRIEGSNETTEVIEGGTEEQEVIEEIEEEKESGKIIGALVGGGKAIVNSKIAYFIGGIFFAGILYLIVFAAQKKLKFKKGGTYLNFQAKDDKKEELKDKIEDKDKELEDAERKLKEAKEELDDIKNRKTRLQEAKEKFKRDKEELMRLEKIE